jgi:hypothetical protein
LVLIECSRHCDRRGGEKVGERGDKLRKAGFEMDNGGFEWNIMGRGGGSMGVEGNQGMRRIGDKTV